MSKIRFFFYCLVLVALMVLYYGIGDSLYSIGHIDLKGGAMLGVELIALIIAPLAIVLTFIRLWLLKPLNERLRLLDVSYFVIPVLLMIACFAAWIWVGIVLSVLAGVLIAYEFIRSVARSNSLQNKVK
jgi:hypothetical protein